MRVVDVHVFKHAVNSKNRLARTKVMKEMIMS